MSVSDLINILALTIAIVALVSEQNRYLLLWKFNVIQRLFLFFALLLVNFLVFYNEYEHSLRNSFPVIINFVSCYNCSLFAKDWAYVVFFITISYIFLVILFGYFSSNNSKDLIRFYQKTILRNEINTFIYYFEKYHLNPVLKSYRHNIDKSISENEIDQKFNTEYHKFRRYTYKHREALKTKFIEVINKLNVFIFNTSSENQEEVSFQVLNRVVFTEENLEKIIATDATLIPPIFFYFSKQQTKYYDTQIVQSYFSLLLSKNSYVFNKELRESLNFTNQPQPESFYSESIIIASVLKNPNVAVTCELSKIIFELTQRDITMQGYGNHDSTLLQINRLEKVDLWKSLSYRAYLLNNLITWELIAKDNLESHWYLLNFRYLFDDLNSDIINRIDISVLSKEEFEKLNVIIFQQEIIDELINILQHCIDKNLCTGIYTTVNNIGDIMYKLSLNSSFFLDLISTTIRNLFLIYCNLHEVRVEFDIETEMKCYKKATEMLTSILLHPNKYHDNPDMYIMALERAWVRFDKVPHRSYSDKPNFQLQKLIADVIGPFDLNPEQY